MMMMMMMAVVVNEGDGHLVAVEMSNDDTQSSD